MNKPALIFFAGLVSAICHSQEFSLSNEWNIQGMPASAARLDLGIVELKLENCSPASRVTQQIKGTFKAGELLRFSSAVKIADVENEKGEGALRPFDLNLHPRNVCLVLAQLDKEGRILSACGSARLLGTTETRLELEVPIQQNVETVELRLQASFVTGKIRYSHMRLEKMSPAPLQELPEAKILSTPTGGCYWEIDGQSKPLAMYFGNNQFNHDDRILEEMEKATTAGVPAFSFNLHLPSMVSNTEQLKIIERFMKPFPDAYFMPRIWLGPGEWKESFPEEMMKYADGHIGGYTAAASDAWKTFTDHNLQELIKLIRRSPYAKQFIGLKLTYQQTGEWIFWDPHLSAGYSETTRQGFIRWLENKYTTIENLNSAWHGNLSRVSEVTLPTEEARNTGFLGAFRDPNTQQREIDFSLFYNTINADNIIHFAQTVKEATENKSLVATFYGYLFELAWKETWPQQSGHLGLEKVYRSPYIDIIGAPYSYNPIGRGFGLPVDFHGPFDGINHYGKIALLEEDTYTHLALNPGAEDMWEAKYAPGYNSRTTSMDETMAVLRRNLGVDIGRNQIHLWQNLFSEGRFNDQQIWDMYKPYLEWMTQRSQTAAPFQPQVAVLASSENIALLKNKAYDITERWLYQPRFFLNRVDVSIGYYLQSDLENLPESVRCVILLNPYRISDKQQTELRQKFMRDGKMIIFCYMPNIYDEKGLNPAASKFCGIDLSLQNKTLMPLSRVTGKLFPLSTGSTFGETQFGSEKDQPYSSYMMVKDPDATVFARYTATDEASCALKKMGDWTSVYLGSSGLPPSLWRELFKEAGCHLYLDELSTDIEMPDFIQANGNFLMVQSATGGKKTIRLPKKVKQVYRFDAARPKPIVTDCTTFRVDLDPGVPAFFVLYPAP